MAAGVDADVAIGEIALQAILEGGDITIVIDQVDDFLNCGPFSSVRVDITAQAARVIVKAGAILLLHTRDVKSHPERAEVDGEAADMGLARV